MTNQMETIEPLIVTKTWVGDHDNAYGTRPGSGRSGYVWETSFVIQRKLESKLYDENVQWEIVMTHQGEKALPLIGHIYGKLHTDSEGKAAVISGLPTCSTDNQPYIYRVRELRPHPENPQYWYSAEEIKPEDILENGESCNDAYVVTYPEDWISIVNTMPETSVSAVKEWYAGDSAPTDLTLEYQKSADKWEAVPSRFGTAAVVTVDGKKDTESEKPFSETDKWTAVWAHLPRRFPGSDLPAGQTQTRYRITEKSPAGSHAADGTRTKMVEQGGTVKFVNVKETSLTVSKVWGTADAAHPDVQIKLYRTTDPNEVGRDDENLAQTAQRTIASPAVSCTFGNLDKYNAEGELYYYYALETEVGPDSPDKAGYRVVYQHTTGHAAESPVTQIVNVGHTDVTAKKIWKDNGNAYGTRPDSLGLTLWRTPAGTEKWEKVDSVTPEPDKTDKNIWIYRYKDLPESDDEGILWQYKVTEKTPEVVTGNDRYVLTETHTGARPFVTTLTNTLTDTVEVEVTKDWIDGGNLFKKRPEAITVSLLQNRSVFQTKTDVTGKASADRWTCSFKELPEYDSDGVRYTYTVTEDAVPGYRSDEPQKTELNRYTLTNRLLGTHEVTKIWSDPESHAEDTVTVKLQRRPGTDGTFEDVAGTDAVLTLSAATGWKGSFGNLEQFLDDGTRCYYRAVETAINGISRDGQTDYLVSEKTEDLREQPGGLESTVISNVKKLSLTVRKVWLDGDNACGTRPEELALCLEQRLSTETEESAWKPYQELCLKPTASGEWTLTLGSLPQSDPAGVLYNYRISEAAPFESAVSGDRYELVSAVQSGGEGAPWVITVTNRLTGKTEVPVVKNWEDNENAFGHRHDSITVTLRQQVGEDGTPEDYKVDGTVQTLTLSGEDSVWKDKFTGLPKYNDQGERYIYTVAETGVPSEYVVSYTPDKAPNSTQVITNTGRGRLTLTKIVRGNSANYKAEFPFTVTFKESPDSEELLPLEGVKYDIIRLKREGHEYVEDGAVERDGVLQQNLTLENGGEIVLGNLQKLVITTELDNGIYYEIEETDSRNHRVTSSGSTGLIEAGKVKEAEFTNSRWYYPPDDPPKEDIPVTGQNHLLPLLLGAGGLLLLGGGIAIDRKNRKRRRHDG